MKLCTFLAASLLALGTPPLVAREPTAPVAAAAAWALPERETMVPVEGGRVWTSVNGDISASAPPVVFIHGGPGGTHGGFGAMTKLADTRAVVLYDQLDSGKSDHPGDPKNWRVARFVSELEAIRKALKIERWHLVGHSWGAAVALEYAAAHPDRVVSTVLSGTYISTPHWILGTNLLVRDLPEQVQRDIAACELAAPRPPEATCQAAEAVFYGQYNGRADAPPPTPEEKAYHAKTRGRGFNAKLYNARLNRNRRLAKDYEARIETVRDFVRLTPGSELAVVPGGSHRAFNERPVEVEGLLRGWLARKDPR